MSITPKTPPADDAGECEGMGQISMKISALPGSVLSENQQRELPEAMKPRRIAITSSIERADRALPRLEAPKEAV